MTVKRLCVRYGFRFVNGRADSLSARSLWRFVHAHCLPSLYDILCGRSGQFRLGRARRPLRPMPGRSGWRCRRNWLRPPPCPDADETRQGSTQAGRGRLGRLAGRPDAACRQPIDFRRLDRSRATPAVQADPYWSSLARQDEAVRRRPPGQTGPDQAVSVSPSAVRRSFLKSATGPAFPAPSRSHDLPGARRDGVRLARLARGCGALHAADRSLLQNDRAWASTCAASPSRTQDQTETVNNKPVL